MKSMAGVTTRFRVIVTCFAFVLWGGAFLDVSAEELPSTVPAANEPQTDATDPTSVPWSPTPAIGNPEASVPSDAELVEPDWCPSPCETSLWRFKGNYGWATVYSDNNEPGRTIQLSLAREEPDGFGRGLQLWWFNQDVGYHYYSSKFAVETIYYDYYRRRASSLGELSLGGGFAGGFIQENLRYYDGSFRYYGGGGSLFADGYFQLTGSATTSFGAIGSARLALLAGVEDNDGHIEVGRGSIAIVDQLAWGFELRHRTSARLDRYWSMGIERRLQDWGSPELPYAADFQVQSTAINLGLNW